MFEQWLYALASVFVVSMISFIGLVTFSIKGTRLLHLIIYLVSLSAGTLIGDAFLHLLPESSSSGFTITVSFSVLLGIASFFVLEKLISWRHCHVPTGKQHPHTFAYMNLVGDGVHNFIDGMIIAASYIASIPIGIATTLAVMLHEIPQEMGDFGVLLHGGFNRTRALLVNFLTALTAVLGAVMAMLLASLIAGLETVLLSFAAGGFIYIALSDLVPELHKKNACEGFTRDAIYQLAFFLSGILIMYSLLFVKF